MRLKRTTNPKKLRRQMKALRREFGDVGVNLYQLLTELADENGQIRFEGDEQDMVKSLQELYQIRFGGDEVA